MHATKLRKAGGSVMLAAPPALLDLLELAVGAAVDFGIENGRLIVQPRERPVHTLDQLLAQCSQVCTPSDEDRVWVDAGRRGTPVVKRGVSGSLPSILRRAMNSRADGRC